MPVVAIGAAALAIGEAAGAVGAVLAGGIGALTVTGALEITAAIGATLGAVGVVTHDKGLTTAGMILGGIGGIGQLAVGAGLFGADAGSASVFGSSTDAAAASVPGSTGAAAAGAAGTSSSSPSASLVDSLGGVNPKSTLPPGVTSPAAPDITGAAASVAPSPDSIISGAVSPTLPTQAPVQPVSVAPNTSLSPAAPAIPKIGNLPGSTAPGAGSVASLSAPSVEAPGVLDSLGNFIKNDKSGMVGYGLIQAAGSLVGGLFDPLKPAQVEALKAQTAQTQAQTQITDTQAKNLNQPLPVAYQSPSRSGLINSYGAAQ